MAGARAPQCIKSIFLINFLYFKGLMQDLYKPESSFHTLLFFVELFSLKLETYARYSFSYLSQLPTY